MILSIGTRNFRFSDKCHGVVKSGFAFKVGELVAGKPHPLRYKRVGQFSVSISGALRLIFECGNNPIPKTNDESVDWSQVSIVRIISIEDYHE